MGVEGFAVNRTKGWGLQGVAPLVPHALEPLQGSAGWVDAEEFASERRESALNGSDLEFDLLPRLGEVRGSFALFSPRCE